MTKAQIQYSWEEGIVDDQKEHIDLRCGDAEKTSYEEWIPIARISKPKHHVFLVEWILIPDSPNNQIINGKARKDIDYYLVEKGEDDPWGYAQYHCNSFGNMYSTIHWSYFPHGRGSERVSSKVIKLSAEEAQELFGEKKIGN
jgi:hypothetical protein